MSIDTLNDFPTGERPSLLDADQAAQVSNGLAASGIVMLESLRALLGMDSKTEEPTSPSAPRLSEPVINGMTTTQWLEQVEDEVARAQRERPEFVFVDDLTPTDEAVSRSVGGLVVKANESDAAAALIEARNEFMKKIAKAEEAKTILEKEARKKAAQAHKADSSPIVRPARPAAGRVPDTLPEAVRVARDAGHLNTLQATSYRVAGELDQLAAASRTTPDTQIARGVGPVLDVNEADADRSPLPAITTGNSAEPIEDKGRLVPETNSTADDSANPSESPGGRLAELDRIAKANVAKRGGPRGAQRTYTEKELQKSTDGALDRLGAALSAPGALGGLAARLATEQAKTKAEIRPDTNGDVEAPKASE